MLQTRTQSRQTSIQPSTHASLERASIMRDRNQTETVLRDLAYVLHLTGKVRNSLTAK